MCAACAEGANRLDGHKGKHTLTLIMRYRMLEKKKGKGAGDVEETIVRTQFDARISGT